MDEQGAADLYHAERKLLTDVGGWSLSDDQRHLSFVSAIERDGVVVEGATFHGGTVRTIADRAVRFQISVISERTQRLQPICRIEWRPLRPHNNKQLGPEALRGLPIRDSHIHCFDLNRLHGDVWHQRNLPVAEPIEPDPDSYRRFLDIVREKFRIDNASSIPEPPWEIEAML